MEVEVLLALRCEPLVQEVQGIQLLLGMVFLGMVFRLGVEVLAQRIPRVSFALEE
ncbi:hypothetical protein MPNT_350021 [Candidatus Methylacidithermus pantelleriae]|uniref:Uncharacterized protein n=1 Tax=Candidatus Methylacidithermus pantelleriae TaxID=2744239 RepID=A0A8J2FRQ5_9BACT|nr:hypothetical protein MPNT_350021 [Candidatus Methylacidithermus pantelleriae]